MLAAAVLSLWPRAEHAYTLLIRVVHPRRMIAAYFVHHDEPGVEHLRKRTHNAVQYK